LVRKVICDIGYDNAEYGYDGKTCGILDSIQTQSPDIAMGVDTGGAGRSRADVRLRVQ
jgi:S-adenosylmethionine synthetase